ncbi:hypothetical protein SynPROS91_01291 [Synechococcus sp. PROS-9-1]|nr:hypothetical protein SynPROS91_01291 [Synechococcus sp. PROS-9-1]
MVARLLLATDSETRAEIIAVILGTHVVKRLPGLQKLP